MNPYYELKEKISEIELKLNYCFKNKELLLLAFVHRSFVNENKKIISKHNERLEFLGDGVLNLTITEYLYKKYPESDEGKLSFFRSQIVDSHSCTLYLNQIEIKDFVLLGKGEKQSEDRGRSSILADLFEAIVGAIYIDGGLEKAKDFIIGKFKEEIDGFLEKPARNYKADLQSYCQKKYFTIPKYDIISESGPEHSKTFLVEASVEDIKLASGEGNSKKEAEQDAAKKALKSL